jgi:POT family proton-dependent oligopeptide transporter
MVCGELCIAPIAMNMVTRLCPKRVVGLMMGAYFLSLSVGSFVASQLAKLTSLKHGGDVDSIDTAIAMYTASFKLFATAGISAAAIVYLISPLLYSRMHEDGGQHGVGWIARLYARRAA